MLSSGLPLSNANRFSRMRVSRHGSLNIVTLLQFYKAGIRTLTFHQVLKKYSNIHNYYILLKKTRIKITKTNNIIVVFQEVNGCVVVNPEHLTKGTGGGTFARLQIVSDNENKRIAAQIVRI